MEIITNDLRDQIDECFAVSNPFNSLIQDAPAI
jgi:hypothetical protein